MRPLAALLAVLLLVSGCKSYELGEEWRPLVAIEETPNRLMPEGIVSTIGNRCYVASLADFFRACPPGSVELEAILRHERVHSERELAGQLPIWLMTYATSRSFRWSEEQLGYREEIRYLVQHGQVVDAEGIADAMATKYRGLDGHMVDYDLALVWVRSEIQGASR